MRHCFASLCNKELEELRTDKFLVFVLVLILDLILVMFSFSPQFDWHTPLFCFLVKHTIFRIFHHTFLHARRGALKAKQWSVNNEGIFFYPLLIATLSSTHHNLMTLETRQTRTKVCVEQQDPRTFSLAIFPCFQWLCRNLCFTVLRLMAESPAKREERKEKKEIEEEISCVSAILYANSGHKVRNVISEVCVRREILPSPGVVPVFPVVARRAVQPTEIVLSWRVEVVCVEREWKKEDSFVSLACCSKWRREGRGLEGKLMVD